MKAQTLRYTNAKAIVIANKCAGGGQVRDIQQV